jgi:hypothetical protein
MSDKTKKDKIYKNGKNTKKKKSNKDDIINDKPQIKITLKDNLEESYESDT